jgi:hypothetical protein
MKVKVDFNDISGPIKIMNAVNNAPVWKRNNDQNINNFESYKAAEIPYGRTHDASIDYGYGREHCVDVHGIFPNFDADENDPASYDFFLTDEYLNRFFLAGTKPFYRLGSCIEHWTKKYGTLPPKDFGKWARICERIISHYNDGWADGYHMNIEYWEIWNEPDGGGDNAPPEDKLTWGGTRQQFFELYEITATYLKEKHPECKIGGPALCYPHTEWTNAFLKYLTRDGKRVPLDFFSWHGYTNDPKKMIPAAHSARRMLDAHGYTETESIYNEWNYVNSFSGNQLVKDLAVVRSLKGAAFIGGIMTAMQGCPVDMLMYYDARMCGFNGLWNIYDKTELKGYHALKSWAELRHYKNEAKSCSDDDEIYIVAGTDVGRGFILITYYTDLENQPAKTVDIELNGAPSEVWCHSRLDEDYDFDNPRNCRLKNGKLSFVMQPNTMLKIISK